MCFWTTFPLYLSPYTVPVVWLSFIYFTIPLTIWWQSYCILFSYLLTHLNMFYLCAASFLFLVLNAECSTFDPLQNYHSKFVCQLFTQSSKMIQAVVGQLISFFLHYKQPQTFHTMNVQDYLCKSGVMKKGIKIPPKMMINKRNISM